MVSDWTHYSIRDRKGNEVHRVGAASDESWSAWCYKNDPEGDYTTERDENWNKYHMVRVFMKEPGIYFRR